MKTIIIKRWTWGTIEKVKIRIKFTKERVGVNKSPLTCKIIPNRMVI